MQNCNASGMASYQAREQVTVDGKPVWVDHFSCHVDYAEVNQTITFQNWHSLGLDGLPKGLPLRVTGGNSNPSPTKGSPRLSTVWYSNFTTGTGSVKDKDFTKPSFLCIPVATEVSDAFFGHKVTTQHVFNADFHKRAHSFPAHVSQKMKAGPSNGDISRAKQIVPGRAFLGSDFGSAMA